MTSVSPLVIVRVVGAISVESSDVALDGETTFIGNRAGGDGGEFLEKSQPQRYQRERHERILLTTISPPCASPHVSELRYVLRGLGEWLRIVWNAFGQLLPETRANQNRQYLVH